MSIWGDVFGGGGGGASTWKALTDTAASFVGKALQFVRVNAGETALELAAVAGGATDYSFLILRPAIGATTKNVFKTFPEVLTAMAAHTGQGIIIIDDPSGFQPVIAIAAGTYDFTGWRIKTAGNSAPILDFADGSTVVLPVESKGITWRFNETTTEAVLMTAARVYLVDWDGGSIINLGSVAAIKVDNAAALPRFVMRGGFVTTPTNFEIFNFVSMLSIAPNFVFSEGAALNTDSIRGAANVSYQTIGPSFPVFRGHGNHAGAATAASNSDEIIFQRKVTALSASIDGVGAEIINSSEVDPGKKIVIDMIKGKVNGATVWSVSFDLEDTDNGTQIATYTTPGANEDVSDYKNGVAAVALASAFFQGVEFPAGKGARFQGASSGTGSDIDFIVTGKIKP